MRKVNSFFSLKLRKEGRVGGGGEGGEGGLNIYVASSVPEI